MDGWRRVSSPINFDIRDCRADTVGFFLSVSLSPRHTHQSAPPLSPIDNQLHHTLPPRSSQLFPSTSSLTSLPSCLCRLSFRSLRPLPSFDKGFSVHLQVDLKLLENGSPTRGDAGCHWRWILGSPLRERARYPD